MKNLYSFTRHDWECGCSLPKNSYKPSQDLLGLQFEEESYRFSGQQDHLVQTDRYTPYYLYIRIVLSLRSLRLILIYFRCFNPDFVLVSAGFDAAIGHPHPIGIILFPVWL